MYSMTIIFPVKEILASCPVGDSGFGVIDDDLSEQLDIIDNELMKRGTLGMESIDWKVVLMAADAVLRRCAHLKAFHAAITAMSQKPAGRDVPAILDLGEYLFVQAWPGLHPQGKRGERLRTAWGQEIIQSMGNALCYVWRAERAIPDRTEDRVGKLITCLREHKIDPGPLEDALKQMKQATTPPSEKETGSSSRSDSSGTGGSARRDLDARERAVLRQDIRALAYRISQFDADADVAYLMRGYAAWLEHKSIPENVDGVVPQMSMPAFIIEEHQNAAKNPDDGALLKLEDRLFLSPDWFEGQKIAADMAGRLGHEDVAHAIRSRCARRLARLPELKTLSYANERTYVPREIAAWAEKLHESKVADEEDVIDKSSDDVADGLESRVRMTNAALAESQSGRETALAKLDLARAFRESNLDAHAALLLDEILREFQLADLADWDRALLNEVEKERKSIPATKSGRTGGKKRNG